ncbi:MAG: lactonase family protein [Ostreibacterium sp.]
MSILRENNNNKMITKETETKRFESAFYVGTYTDGKSEGIYSYSLSSNGKLTKNKLVASSVNPSFLAFSSDRQYLLAANETKNNKGQGTVTSYKITKDSLIFISQSLSGGANPCFVAVNHHNYVLTANYSSGNVGLLKLDDKGTLSNLLYAHQHNGKGTHKCQDGPHAHSVWFYPNHQDNVIEVDLGTNQLWFTNIDEKKNELVPRIPKVLNMKKESGPRHMAFHPNGKWAYVINELNSTVTVLSVTENNDFIIKEVVSTLPKNFKGENTGADIHVSSDGQFLYTSNRGSNAITIFKIEDNGMLIAIAHEPVRGNGPRNFALSPDESFLLVANQYTNNVTSFKRDKNKGLLSFIDEIEAPAPVCILFK